MRLVRLLVRRADGGHGLAGTLGTVCWCDGRALGVVRGCDGYGLLVGWVSAAPQRKPEQPDPEMIDTHIAKHVPTTARQHLQHHCPKSNSTNTLPTQAPRQQSQDCARASATPARAVTSTTSCQSSSSSKGAPPKTQPSISQIIFSSFLQTRKQAWERVMLRRKR